MRPNEMRSTFDRYNIARIDDLADAMTKTAAYVETSSAQRNGEQRQRGR